MQKYIDNSYLPSVLVSLIHNKNIQLRRNEILIANKTKSIVFLLSVLFSDNISFVVVADVLKSVVVIVSVCIH